MKRIHSRLRALERSARPAGIYFPGWDFLSDVDSCKDWLEKHGFENLLQAYLAGVRGPLLEIGALQHWLHQEGFTDAADAVAKGGLVKVPSPLNKELRIRAFYHHYHEVSDLILHGYDLDIKTLFDGWKKLQDHLDRQPISAPDDALLAEAQRLATELKSMAGPAEPP